MAKQDIISVFKALMLVQLFWAFIITTTTYAMPGGSINYVNSFADLTTEVNMTSISRDVQSGIQQQTNIPVIDVGALVFYSGNLLIDLLLNFVFAIPEMLGLLVAGITSLFALDSTLVAIVELFSGAVIIVIYFVNIIQLLTGIRSGRIV